MSLPRHTFLPRSPIKRGDSRLGRAVSKARGRIRRVGKKGLENRRALAVFKRECVRLGIDRCEVRGSHCTGAEDLTWAHGRKRRELLEGELETFAIVACRNCHRPLDEELTHAEMAAEVSRIHGLRPERYLEAA
jgi:hypothetical protein